MPSILKNTPLSALEAVVLDTETTGLDVSKARIIEIGLASHGMDDQSAFSWAKLVNPMIPIPASSRDIHGISDEMVSKAETFAAIWQEAQSLMARQVIIGHSLGFDLAILKNECERAKLPWLEPVWLDTRYLALLLDARLPDYTVSALGAWLNVPMDTSHRALADAKATSAIFSAMVPRLRQKGVHTFGEALVACRRIQTMSEDLMRAGWAEPPQPHKLSSNRIEDTSPPSFDAYPFQHRVASLMNKAPEFIAPEAPISTALHRIAEKQISSIYVGTVHDAAGQIGIVTERDLLRALTKHGAAGFGLSVGSIASRPLATIRDGAYVYRAIGTMARLGIRHLGVVGDDNDRIVGALSQRDLLRLRAQSSLILGDEVDNALTVSALGRGWAKLPLMAESLLKEGIAAPEIAGIIARELGALTRRATVLAEQEMVKEGKGSAPTDFAVMVLGSAGRGESLLAMDQDNAIVFAEGEPDSANDRWFAELGHRLAQILNEVGVPLCTGGVMAREPAFRGSIQTWEERMDMWLGRSNSQDLLNVDIVFDARTVHGNPQLFHHLLLRFRDAASENSAFLKLLISSHPDTAAPISLFGSLKDDGDGRLDLKRHIISRVVSAARVIALRHRQNPRSTSDRLASLRALDLGSFSNLDQLIQAYERAQNLVLQSQLHAISEGRKPDNRIQLSRLSPMQKVSVKADLREIENLGEIVRSAMF